MRKYMPIGYEVIFFFMFDYKTSRLSNETMYLSSFDQETLPTQRIHSYLFFFACHMP